MSGRARAAQAAAWLSGLSVLWAVAITFAGGLTFRLGALRVSSNNPENPLLLALAAGWGAWTLATPAQRGRLRGFVASVASAPTALAPVVAALAAAATVAIGITQGASYVGSADSYGYVSQADLWAHGTLTYREPLAREFDWPFAGRALAPLAYLPMDDGETMAPVYAPGLPLAMAAFQVVAGRAAVFLVVPILSGLAILATYWMGARLVDRTVGAAAAVLLATSPAFLFHVLDMPMSDAPATAWWALALSLGLVNQRGAAFGAGLAAGAATATRPNLVPLVLFVAAPILYDVVRDRTNRRRAIARLAWLSLGAMPGLVIVAVVNDSLFGSPFLSGQLLVNPPFSAAHVAANLWRYSTWLFQTQTPAVLAALAAPFLLTRAAEATKPRGRTRAVALAWLGLVGAVLASYLFFIPSDHWVWLRYLLPAFPALFVLTAAALAAGFARYGRDIRVVGLAVFVGVLALRGAAFARGEGVFSLEEGQQRFRAVGEFVAADLPDRAVFISVVHGGNIRYYAARPTVRYDMIPPPELDRVVADLRSRGYRPYAVLDVWEETLFRRTFEGHSRLAALDWAPVAAFGRGPEVRVYDLDVGR